MGHGLTRINTVKFIHSPCSLRTLRLFLGEVS